MGFAKTHKKGSLFSVDSKDFEIKKLNDLELGKEYPVKGVYILSKRGKMRNDMPNVISDGFIVNAPYHMIDDVRDIMANDEYIDQIENGGLYFSIYEYTNDEGSFRSINWIDKE